MRASADILRPGRARAGFTIIEVLIVVTIIVILVGMVIPTMNGIRRQLYAARTLTSIQSLETACQQYQRDTGYFPGQRDSVCGSEGSPPGIDPWGGDDTKGAWTGSQWLARALLTPPGAEYGDEDDPNWMASDGDLLWPAENYIVDPHRMLEKRDGEVIPPTGPADRDNDPAFVDAFLDPMPIHYWPAKLGREGRPADRQYNPNHGRATGEDGVAFIDYIKVDPGEADSLPVHDGTFILISPGPDRRYFTRDDVTNFRR